MTTVRSPNGSGSSEALHDRQGGALAHVVAVHRDVDHTGGDTDVFERLDIGGEPLRQFDAARRNAGEDEALEVGIALDDFVRDAAQSTPEGFRIEDAGGVTLVRRFVFFHFLRDLTGSL